MRSRINFDVRWVLTPVLLLVGIWCIYYASTLRVTNIVVEGNEVYSQEEVANLVFPEEKDTNLCGLFFKYHVLHRQNSIPFVQKYHVEILGIDTVKVTVYEKKIIGCFAYMSNYMYFDRDGIIVDSLNNVKDGVPLIEGFLFKQVVMYEQLPVENDAIFNEILNLTQLLGKDDIAVQKVSFDANMHVTLYMEEPMEHVKVILGDSTYLADKLKLVEGMQSELEGLNGTLYLDGYQPGAATSNYIFKQNKEG